MTEHTGPTQPTRLFAPLAIIVAIPLIFAAVFFYTTPVVIETGGNQGIFKCGSPSSPNSDAKNVCGVPEAIAQKKAIFSGLSGVGLLGLGAVWLLRSRPQEDDWDEPDGPRRNDDDWERDRRRRGDADWEEREPSRRDDDRDQRGRSRREEDHPDEREGRDGASPRSEHLDPAESRTARLHGRRSDDAPRRRREPRDRRSDDDWASDGWR